jgi:FG-GAP-like repeat
MEKSMAGVFQVLYGMADGTFRQAEVLKGTDGEPLIIPAAEEQSTENICTRPFAVDWDADGHLDLVVGNFAGTFYWFKGQGRGQFQPKPEAIHAGDSALEIDGVHSDPFVVDWDGDGDLDLLSGSSNGGVRWAENSAGKGKLPVLQPFQTLIEVGQSIAHGQPLDADDLTGPTRSTRIWVDDVNGDGKLDLLVGDSVTLISPGNGLSEEEFKEKFEAWQKAIAAASSARSAAIANQAKKADEGVDADEANAANEDNEGDADKDIDEADKADELTRATEELHRLYDQRSEFMQEDRTGFVWLYLQK